MKTEENTKAYAVTPAVAVDIVKRLTVSLAQVEFAGDAMCQYERSEDDTPEGKRVRYDCNWQVNLPVPVATPQGRVPVAVHTAFTMSATLGAGGRYDRTQIDISEIHVVEAEGTRIRNLGAANLYMGALCAALPPIYPGAEEGQER